MLAAQNIIIHVVGAVLYHERYRKLHQSLTLMYPLVIALPNTLPAPHQYLPAVIGALLYANGLASTDALRQPFYIELVTGMSIQELGLDCVGIGRGLQSVRGR